ncbi:MAG: PQQ-binding-like beta-propeller repeat protein, partial [Vulcanimicrobiaceae bacterium]
PPGSGVVSTDWDTFAGNAARTGESPSESTLDSANVHGLQQLWQMNVGGGLAGQPIVATGVSIGGTAHDVIYIGATSGDFTAIDAATGTSLWHHSLGTITYPLNNNPGAAVPFGVTGTPTIDRSTNSVYVVDGQDQLYQFDLATGAEVHPHVAIDPAGEPGTGGADVPANNVVWSALALNPTSHLLYITTSSEADVPPWYGRIVAFDARSLQRLRAFYTVNPPTLGDGAGIWSYGGVSLDAAGNVWAATGNFDVQSGNQTEHDGLGEQVIEVSSDLGTLKQNNYPGLEQLLAQLGETPVDADFGSTPVLFTPPGCDPLAIAINKAGILVVYDQTKVDAGPTQRIAMAQSSENGDFIGLVGYSSATNYVYVSLPSTFNDTIDSVQYRPGLAAFRFSNCTLVPQPVWAKQFGIDSSNDSNDDLHSSPTIANGVVYVGDGRDKKAYAFDAGTGTALWGPTAMPGAVYTAPVVLNGRVYISTSYGATLTAFGVPGVSPNAARASSGGLPKARLTK